LRLQRFKMSSPFCFCTLHCLLTEPFFLYLSIYLSGLVTAVAVFRNPNTIPFCLATDLLLNVLFSWLLVHLPFTFFLDVLFFFLYPLIKFPVASTCTSSKLCFVVYLLGCSLHLLYNPLSVCVFHVYNYFHAVKSILVFFLSISLNF